MKQSFTTWLPPVSVSLLLHMSVILLYLHQPQRTAPARLDTLLVEMETISSKPASPPVSRPQPRTEPKIEPEKQPDSEPVPTPQVASLQSSISPVLTTTEKATATNTSSQPEIQPLTKLTRPPAFLRKIDPVYPASEQRSGSQAFVLAEVTLDAEGKLLEVKILKSAGKLFDEAVLEAIRNSVFQPGYIESKPVAVRVQVPFRFKLN